VQPVSAGPAIPALLSAVHGGRFSRRPYRRPPLAAAETRPALPNPTAARLPRWRGFNLLEKFRARQGGNPPFAESDFAWIAGWGVNFVRRPMSYHCWAAPESWLNLREAELLHIDQAIEFGWQYDVHVNLNLHRAPVLGRSECPPEFRPPERAQGSPGRNLFTRH